MNGNQKLLLVGGLITAPAALVLSSINTGSTAHAEAVTSARAEGTLAAVHSTSLSEPELPESMSAQRSSVDGKARPLLIEQSSAASPVPWAAALGEIRELASTPQTFHGLAPPIIDSMESIIRDSSVPHSSEDGALRQGDEASVALLMSDVVADSSESPLVRGAVLMAVARLLSSDSFLATLDSWFAVESNPMELLRAGAIAAARRGEQTRCSMPVSLAELSRMQRASKADLPGIYPVEVRGMVGLYEAAILEEWLSRPDARSEFFRLSRELPPEPEDPVSVGEYLVTAEVIFTLWGHRSLEDPHVEARVIGEATFFGAEEPTESVVYFRPASLLAYSLALCNEQLFDLVSTMASSSNAFMASMARQMENLAGGGPLGISRMARIESMRYEEEAKYDLMIALVKVGERMGTMAKQDAQLVEDACHYLDGLVQDTAVDESARASALTAISESGSWPSLKKSASEALYADAPMMVSAVAAARLIREARRDPQLRGEVLDIFLNAKSRVTKDWLLADLEAFISELS